MAMATEQGALFNPHTYRGQKPLGYDVQAVRRDQTVLQTLPAYHLYLSDIYPDTDTPDNYTVDIKHLGDYTSPRAVSELQTTHLQQWLESLKTTMAKATISRKASAMANYFDWLTTIAKVLEVNPAEHIRGRGVTSPTPDLLYEKECDELLRANSSDPRTYLLILLFLETGMKRAELLALTVADFDFSDRYQPVVQLRHTGRHVVKDRRIKLPALVVPVFDDYVQRYHITGRLFPCTSRSIATLLNDAGMRGKTRKPVTPSMLRDICVVRGIKTGEDPETMFVKIGLSKDSYDDARKKYKRLTSEAL